MRYIYLDASKIDADWLKKANEVTANIKAETDPKKRRALIKKNAALWGKPEVKHALLEMSHKKCWYTEADDCVSDWHVDHFRPKSNYQWLAFEWTNYRISGGIPNRKKSNYFPLDDQAKCATFGAPDITCEEPLFLDPAKLGDADLVTYDEQGELKPIDPNDATTLRRVDATCKGLNLNDERLIKRRQGVWNACREKVDQIRELIDAEVNLEKALMSDHVKKLAAEVKKSTKPDAPFSAVAKAFLRTTRAEWINDIPDLAA
jgi:uncharacterized protein (TIGR02646 family)